MIRQLCGKCGNVDCDQCSGKVTEPFADQIVLLKSHIRNARREGLSTVELEERLGYLERRHAKYLDLDRH